MKVYLTNVFCKWADDESVTNDMLLDAVEEVEKGLIDAKLGGGLIKKRVAAEGKGKRGSFRTLIAIKMDDKAFFIVGFAKNEKDNVTQKELKALKALSKLLLSTSDDEIKMMLNNRTLRQIR